jgi:hypothetical protein
VPLAEKSILIYSAKATPRLLYICDLLFSDLLGLDFEITTDKETFLREPGAKINYSNESFGNDLFINASSLLFEHHINPQKIEVKEWNGSKVFFLSEKKAKLPYDPLATAFYMVSRYEEYLHFDADEFGRFTAEDSLAFKENFLNTPIVNHFALHLKGALLQRFPHLKITENNFRFLLTYDIDQAYAYREKGWLRTSGGIIKSLIKGNIKAINERISVLQHKENDPFDTFDWQFKLHKNLSLNPHYFLLLGDYNKYDNNINWKNAALQKLIKKLSGHYPVGIHFSIASNKKKLLLQKEITRLENITGKQINTSRQHFLMLKFPETYERLIACGITQDYSMGYSSQLGFRAGIASPFYFYDLKKEEKTRLKIYPFAVMDATLFYYLNYTADTAFEKTISMIDEVKKAGGLFIFLAHNDLLNDTISKSGWRENFEKIIRHAKSLE